MKKYLVPLTIVGVVTVIFGTIYGVSQQVMRASADDPQIQLAEDTAVKVETGAKLSDLFKDVTEIDMAKSLAPFVVVYDKQTNEAVAGDGYLNGALPKFPGGVFTHIGAKDYYAITWQPTDTLRIASVSVKANNYYVMSGRSLKEVEKRENSLLLLATFGWVVSVAAASATLLYSYKLKTKKLSPKTRD